MNCVLCEKHKTLDVGFKIFESNDFLVAHWPAQTAEEKVPMGYLFIEPKNHITAVSELTDEQARLMGLWTKKLDYALTKNLNLEKTYFFKFADLTPHIHVHVYARYPQTPKDIVGEGVRHWSDFPKGNRQQILDLCQKLREDLNER